MTGPAEGRGRESLTVEIFGDVICPFAYVGLRKLVRLREAHHHDEVRFRLRAWPLELVNGEPTDPRFLAEKIEVLKATVAPELFEHFDPDNFPSTSMPALELAAYAYWVDQVAGECVSLQLRQALFEEGRNVENRAVLALVAERCGLSLPDLDGWREAVLDDWREGTARGVMGSPHVFLPAGRGPAEGYFCPLLTIDRVEGHLAVEWSQAGLSAVEAACLA